MFSISMFVILNIEKISTKPLTLYTGLHQSKIDAKRILHLVVHLTSVTILASYSAALTSFLTIKTVQLPFTTLQGLIDDGTYNIGVLTGSADHVLLRVI